MKSRCLEGCFWHGCPEHGTHLPANADWWAVKLRRNKVRDAETDDLLRSACWRVLRLWEHEDPQLVTELVCSVVQAHGET